MAVWLPQFQIIVSNNYWLIYLSILLSIFAPAMAFTQGGKLPRPAPVIDGAMQHVLKSSPTKGEATYVSGDCLQISLLQINFLARISVSRHWGQISNLSVASCFCKVLTRLKWPARRTREAKMTISSSQTTVNTPQISFLSSAANSGHWAG